MQNENSFQGVFSILKGLAIALCCSLIFALVFAFVLRVRSIPEKAIYPVNQVLKTLALAVGGLLCIRGEKGFVKGGVLGLLFTMLSYLTFSAIGGDFSLSWLILVELLGGVLTGALCGIIAVNLR